MWTPTSQTIPIVCKYYCKLTRNNQSFCRDLLLKTNQLINDVRRRNPFASGCRGISAKRSQLNANRAFQLGDGRSGETMPNARFRDASSAPGQWPPIAELMIVHRWLLAECSAMRSPTVADLLQSSLSLQQQQGDVERKFKR